MGETIFCIVVTVITLLIGIYNLSIAILGLFSKHRAIVIGTLKNKNTQRNVQARWGKIPVKTDYTYQYTVNGRKYNYHGSVFAAGKRVSKTAPMVYVKWFPRHAYPWRFTAVNQWAWGICMLVMGLTFTLVILIVP